MFLLVPAYPGSPGQKAVKRLCVCIMAIGLQSTLWLERLTTPFTTNVRKCIHLKYEIQTLPTALIDVLEDNQHYILSQSATI